MSGDDTIVAFGGRPIPLPNVRLHSGIFHPVLRKWQCTETISSINIMYPIFILDIEEAKTEVESMPGIFRYGVNNVVEELKPLVEKGLKSILLFGVVTLRTSQVTAEREFQISGTTQQMMTDFSHQGGLDVKDKQGTNADSNKNPVIKAIPIIKAAYPDIVIACDVCLCPYTSHGHCGILRENGTINNEQSICRIAEVAVSYARAGCHIVAPSDMMDGRVGAIKHGLAHAGLDSNVSVLAYSVKFASVFYGPFRNAAQSCPSFGDRKAYQLPPGSAGMAVRAAARDVAEGCDMLMVKPGLAYLDIVRQTKDAHPHLPLFVYQVSGEYAMLYHAAKAGAFSLVDGVRESLMGFRRAGADCVITYFAPLILDWLAEGKL